MLGLAFAAHAHAATVAMWTFEQSHPTSAGPFAPEVGQGIAAGSTHGTFRNDQAVLGNFVGNGSTWSFASHGWQAGDYFQFQVSTLGRNDIHLSWDQTRSFNGPADFALQYSTDGHDFHDFALYSVLWNQSIVNRLFWDVVHPRQSVYTFNFNLAAVDAIDNAPTVFFRLRASEDGAVPEGSGRVDNLQVTAASTAIPLPSAGFTGLIVLAAVCGFLSLRRRAARIM